MQCIEKQQGEYYTSTLETLGLSLGHVEGQRADNENLREGIAPFASERLLVCKYD